MTPLEESARLAGGHAWRERRLFEIVGGWVATTPEPEAKLLFDRHSHHHAWRAGQWWDRLPVLADVDREELAGTAGPGMAAALEVLAAAESTTARLAGTARFALPRLWSGYEGHRRVADDVADGSSLRTLTIVMADVTADWQEAEARLQNLIDREDAVESAAALVVQLENVLLGH